MQYTPETLPTKLQRSESGRPFSFKRVRWLSPARFLWLIGCAAFSAQPAFSIDVPLQADHPNWQLLSYDSLPTNQLSQSEEGLRIQVRGSASPLIYVLDQPTNIHALSASGHFSALPKIPAGSQQGDQGADDFGFRWGLVVSGDKKLNLAQKLIAPQWVKTLYALAETGEAKSSGVDRIVFLNIANQPAPDWEIRQHPLGKGLMEERIVSHQADAGDFHLQHTLSTPLKVIAFWFSIDGDDTQSDFDLTLRDLSYQ